MVGWRSRKEGILQDTETGQVNIEAEESEGNHAGEDSDGDFLPIAGGCADFGIEEAREEVPHQLESVAVGFFQPLAEAGDHAATTSSMRRAMASVSSGLVS